MLVSLKKKNSFFIILYCASYRRWLSNTFSFVFYIASYRRWLFNTFSSVSWFLFFPGRWFCPPFRPCIMSFILFFFCCSCVPLYNFSYTYEYLLSSSKSFVDRWMLDSVNFFDVPSFRACKQCISDYNS